MRGTLDRVLELSALRPAVTRPRGSSFELEASRVRGLTAADLAAQVEKLSAALELPAGATDETAGTIDQG